MRAAACLVCLLVALAGCGAPAATNATDTDHPSQAGATVDTTVASARTPIARTPITRTPTTRPGSLTTTDRPDRPAAHRWRVTVTHVVDGDTMDVAFANGSTTRIRLLGVDTPEVYGANSPDEFEGIPETEAGEAWLHGWGENASAFAERELDGREVTIALDPAADTYGSCDRLLVYVRVDGELFNRQLLARGDARYYDAPLTRAAAFQRVEARARANHTGLWGYPAS